MISREDRASNRRILLRSGLVLLLAGVSEFSDPHSQAKKTQKKKHHQRKPQRNKPNHDHTESEGKGVRLASGKFIPGKEIHRSERGFAAHNLLAFQEFTTEEQLAQAVAKGEKRGLFLLPKAPDPLDVFSLVPTAEAKKRGGKKNCKRKNGKRRKNCNPDRNSDGSTNPGGGTTDPGGGTTTPGESRRNIATYTLSEMRELTDQINALKSSGRYDEYVVRHFRAMNTAHSAPIFFPWHRQFLIEFERDLGIPLPYWRWEQGLPPNLISPDGFGTDGDPGNNDLVLSTPFGHWHGLIYDSGSDTLVPRSFEGLVRAIGRDGTASLPTPGDIQTLMGITTYDGGSFNRSSPFFRNLAEGWGSSEPRNHNRSHTYISGDLSAGTSPNDPLFFLLHANVDRIWWEWQQLHGINNYQGPAGQGMNDPMPHLLIQTTPQQVMNIADLGYSYAA